MSKTQSTRFLGQSLTAALLLSTLAFMVACGGAKDRGAKVGKDPNGRKALSPKGASLVEKAIGEAFQGNEAYDANSKLNRELAERVGAVSAYMTNSESQAAADVEVRLQLKGEAEPLVAQGMLDNKNPRLNDMRVSGTANSSLSVQGRCVSAKCDAVLIHVKERRQEGDRRFVAIFVNQRENPASAQNAANARQLQVGEQQLQVDAAQQRLSPSNQPRQNQQHPHQRNQVNRPNQQNQQHPQNQQPQANQAQAENPRNLQAKASPLSQAQEKCKREFLSRHAGNRTPLVLLWAASSGENRFNEFSMKTVEEEMVSRVRDESCRPDVEPRQSPANPPTNGTQTPPTNPDGSANPPVAPGAPTSGAPSTSADPNTSQSPAGASTGAAGASGSTDAATSAGASAPAPAAPGASAPAPAAPPASDAGNSAPTAQAPATQAPADAANESAPVPAPPANPAPEARDRVI